MCGEHRSIVGIGVACQGSSPHVRGARLGSTLNAAAMGIIPACAGSTLSLSTTQALRWDHPRMCGEHDSRPSSFGIWPGSSPHVRGARRVCHGASIGHGIIPACAGSTSTQSNRMEQNGDHPRMCGEHPSPPRRTHGHRGSSPHVRGALQHRERAFFLLGIIPACAGSTPARTWLDCYTRDHPRMCGEHRRQMAKLLLNSGSSPHVRGAQSVALCAVVWLGIIPACAGSTQ